MKAPNYPALGIGMLLLVIMSTGCFAGIQLTTEGVVPKTVTGTYDLYLYGCLYSSDIENAAILVAADAPYPLEIYSFDTTFKVRKGLSAEKAVAEANAFIRCTTKKVLRSEMRRIEDGQGRTYGYDLRAIYMPWEIRISDPLRLNYVLNDGKVTAYIRLAPGAEDDPGGGNNGRGGGGK
jgi:hypothetical protein